MSQTIRLYQNCILRNDYKEVISNKYGALTFYLSTLTHLDVYNSNEDEIYFTNSGSISIDNTGITIFDANKYNYLTFTSSGHTRYAFIKNITLVNSCAIINYEEDLFSNYGDTIKIRPSMLEVSKFIDTTGYTNLMKDLPCEYMSTQPLKRVPIITGGVIDGDKMMIVLNMSLYKMASDKITAREFHTCILKYSALSDIHKYTWEYNNETLVLLNNLYSRQADLTLTNETLELISPGLGNGWNYEIVSIKLIPKYYLFNATNSLGVSMLHDVDTLNEIAKISNEFELYDPNTQTIYPITLEFCALDKDSLYGIENKGVDFETYTHEEDVYPNFKTIGIGTFSTFLPYKFYGDDFNNYKHQIQFLFQLTSTELRFLLSYNSELIDITADFEYHPPISVQSADITYAQQQAQQFNELNSTIKVWTDVFGALGLGARSANSGGGLGGAVMNLATGTIPYALSAYQDVYAMFMTKDKKYATNHSIATSNASVHNGFEKGIFFYEMNPENSDQVDAIVNRFGYRRDLLIEDESRIVSNDANTNPYQYAKFTTISLYGEFSQDIADVFVQMFLNGVFIYYNTNAI